MALHILCQISTDIAKNQFLIMADECTDPLPKKLFVICIRWVDNTLIIGLYNIDTIDSNKLAATIEYVLLRMSLNLTVLWSMLRRCIQHGRM